VSRKGEWSRVRVEEMKRKECMTDRMWSIGTFVVSFPLLRINAPSFTLIPLLQTLRTQDESAVIDIEQDDDNDDNVSDVSAEEDEDLATKIAILERLRGRRGSSFSAIKSCTSNYVCRAR
jgi:hypothetical protein